MRRSEQVRSESPAPRENVADFCFQCNDSGSASSCSTNWFHSESGLIITLSCEDNGKMSLKLKTEINCVSSCADVLETLL